ncbi:Wzz/FepE/Etk N-terminal domain-containing protein [Kaistia adipata]|uniref:Wzz/FepE/Etk N-terminal domain-containing protein n=1 Tax=Kaistia adipata TaxID=166954 RepID=UPI000402AB92|nr:Wzz/FepE/Etk N-terminal domain-containing protein [Kaistia adipata]
MLDGRSIRLAADDDGDIAGPSGSSRADRHANGHGAPQDRNAADRLRPPPPTLDPWRLFRLIRRQAWTVVAVVAAVMLLTLLLLGQLTPIYKTSALVIVDPWQRSMLDTDADDAPRPTDGARIESEVEILRSPAVLLAVQTKLGLGDDPEFAARPSLPARLGAWIGLAPAPLGKTEAEQATLKRLEQAITVARRGATHVIAVTARSADPAKAAEIANATAAAYIDAQIEAKVAFAASVQQRLAQQLETTRVGLREMERKLDSFLDDSIVSIQDPELRAELGELRAAITEQATTRLRYDALAGRSRERARKREWDALIAELNSDRLVRLNAEHAAIRRQLGTNGDGAGTATMAKLTQLDRQIDKEAQAVIDRIAAEAVLARESETELRARLSRRLAGSDVPADIVLHFREAEGDAAALRQVVDKLTSSSTTAMAEIDLQLPDSRIVSAALVPATPASPNKPLILTLAGLLALALGIGAAALRDGATGGFADEAALEQFTGVPVLAALPTIPVRADRPGDGPATETLAHPHGPYGEAIRRLKLGLERGARGTRPGRVLLVTAATPGEGATLTAIALARSLGVSGRRTLLIDGDLRRPSIHTELGLSPRHSVADYLAGRGIGGAGLTIDDVAPNLAIASGPADPRLNLDTLLQSNRLDQLLHDARRNFDHVVIDSPPVLAAVDTLLLIPHADDVLMVVDSATPARDVGAAFKALARNGRGTAHLWLALNRVAGAVPRRARRRRDPAAPAPGPAAPAPPAAGARPVRPDRRPRGQSGAKTTAQGDGAPQ